MTGGAGIGLVLGSREAELAHPRDPGVVVEEAVTAEALGFSSIWVGDSLARRRGDPLVLLGAIASRTTAVTLGVATLAAALRPPLVTAHGLSTLERLAAGRLVVAVGTGFPSDDTRQECRAVGVDYRTRAFAADAAVMEWRRLWRRWQQPGPSLVEAPAGSLECRAVTDERHADAQTAVDRTQRAGPPVWLAGSSPRALAWCGARYDGWLAYPPQAGDYRRQLATVAGHAGRLGRATPTPACLVTVSIDRSPDRARLVADDYCRRYYGRPLDLVEQVQAFAIGSADRVADVLATYVRAGVRHLLVRPAAIEPGHRRDTVAEVAELAVGRLSRLLDDGRARARTGAGEEEMTP